jgi:Alw26I/Eco31I/Esp3I family type II restriction m6 adenine DNA methyltransferase
MAELITTRSWLETIKERFSEGNLTGKNINFLAIFENLTNFHQKQLESERLFETNKRKHFGIYYTPYSIAKIITESALEGVFNKDFFLKAKFLEPCMGGGIFIIAYIDFILDRFPDLTDYELQKIVNNIYGADIDVEGMTIFQKFFPIYIQSRYGKEVILKEDNFHIGDMLFKVNESGVIEKNDPKNLFNDGIGFDVILTNPPYKLLKANANKYGENNSYAAELKNLISYIKAHKFYNFNSGILNLYRLFVEEIFENYSKADGRIGLLIPQTFLNDKQSEKLRKRMFLKSQISKVFVLNEKNNYFPDITQSFCFFSALKGKNTEKIYLQPNITNESDLYGKEIEIDTDLITGLSESFPIIYEESIGWDIINKIQKHKKIKELQYIINARGELDLTLNKNFISDTKTTYPLLRGVNIKDFVITQNDKYVNEDFLNAINGKQEFVKKERIICQQISNMNSFKRLKFAKISDNMILGNSCNFIALRNTLIESPLSLDYLLGVLNSYLLDWRFKVTSSNNHINNYELAELPIPIPNKKQSSEIELIVKRILEEGHSKELQITLNNAVYNLYGLEKDEINYINSKYIK